MLLIDPEEIIGQIERGGGPILIFAAFLNQRQIGLYALKVHTERVDGALHELLYPRFGTLYVGLESFSKEQRRIVVQAGAGAMHGCILALQIAQPGIEAPVRHVLGLEHGPKDICITAGQCERVEGATIIFIVHAVQLVALGHGTHNLVRWNTIINAMDDCVQRLATFPDRGGFAHRQGNATGGVADHHEFLIRERAVGNVGRKVVANIIQSKLAHVVAQQIAWPLISVAIQILVTVLTSAEQVITPGDNPEDARASGMDDQPQPHIGTVDNLVGVEHNGQRARASDLAKPIG